MPERYAYRIPTDPARLSRIPPSERAKFDRFQKQLFIAYQVNVGDWLCFRASFGEAFRGGPVTAVLKGRNGYPVFAVDGYAVEVHDIEDPAGVWFLMAGDEVEVQCARNSGEWVRARVKTVLSSRQWPLYRVEGSRRQFSPFDVRLVA